MSDFENQPQHEIHFSKKIRAGKRTYYFDVKSTRNNDFYLTITESKRIQGEQDDKPSFEKHKLFLYKEDFEKFGEGLRETLAFIQENVPAVVSVNHAEANVLNQNGNTLKDVDFDDLGK